MTNDNLQEAFGLKEAAETYYREKNLEEAYHAYNEAGVIFRHNDEHVEASKCFERAARSEKMRLGIESAFEIGKLTHLAAEEAAMAGRYHYARWLYKEAGLLYEREGDYEHYSNCFMEAQEVHIKNLWKIVTTGQIKDEVHDKIVSAPLLKRAECLSRFCFGIISKYLWGYGEKPFRLIFVTAGVIFASALAIHVGGFEEFNKPNAPVNFLDALYFSGVNFTTLGYGDYVPLGWSRFISVVEALCGLFLISLFVVALTRRFLRVYR